MTDINEKISILFTQGLTRDQFIAKYKEISENKSNDSIFNKDLDSETIGLMYDSFHKSSEDGITEQEIQAIKALDGDDSSFSIEDFQKVYENALYYKSDITIQNRRELLIQNANLKKAAVLKKIENLKERKLKNENDIKAKVAKIEQENNAYKRDLEQKQRLLKSVEDTNERKIKEKEKELENTENESDKASINSELNTLRAHLSTKNTLNREIKRINNFISKNETQIKNLNKSIESKNKPIDKEISEQEIELKNIDRTLELDLEDLLVEEARIHEENAALIASGKYKNGKRYDNIAGSFDSRSIDFNKNNNAISFSSLKQKGLKYDASKGHALAKDIARHSIGFTGYCAKYVNNALERLGLDHTRGDACDRAATLANNKNFQEISPDSVDLRNLPAGCILVYDRGAAGYSSQYGHIEVTLGDGTACSDGRTRNIRKSDKMRIFVPVSQA